MAIDERDRHRLYDRLEQVLGPEEATILMAHLPPVGWADVATKHDLAVLKRDLDAVETALRREIEAFGETNRLEHEALEHRLTAAWRGGPAPADPPDGDRAGDGGVLGRRTGFRCGSADLTLRPRVTAPALLGSLSHPSLQGNPPQQVRATRWRSGQ